MRTLKYNPDLQFPRDPSENRQLGSYRGYGPSVESSVDNPVFEDTIRLDWIYYGRSSLKMHFKSVVGERRYSMFFSDFEDVMAYHTLRPGAEFTDKFHIENKGGYYGIVAHCGRSIDED